MAFKFVIFACALAAANAGLIGAPVAYSAPLAYAQHGYPSLQPSLTSQSTNVYNNGISSLSSHQKTIDTPFSSQYKSDVRVSNPSIQTYAHAPVAYAAAPAPLAYATAPAYAHAAPAYAHAAPIGYAAAAAPVVKTGLLGVAYSPANVVSHMTYSAPAIGLSYGW